MSRELRIQFPGAIYHVTSRGNRRQDIVTDDLDRDTFFERVGKTVEKYLWQMFAAVLMTNHFHLFFRTPEANLSRGMQFLLGGYAKWWNGRQHRSGHVFQGRFRGHLVENEVYYWNVSRYVHLNPYQVLVDRPEEWKWSSYAGYIDPSRRLPWIDYDAVLAAWHGDFGCTSPAEAYREFVESAMAIRRQSPFEQAIDGWILGSPEFADRVRELISPENRQPSPTVARRKMPLTKDELLQAICTKFTISASEVSRRGSRHPARALFAYLGQGYTAATLNELGGYLGLSRPDSVPTQIRRVVQSPADSYLRRHLTELIATLNLDSSQSPALRV